MGFRVNVPKSTLTPTQTLIWLGMEWDTARAWVRLSPENASKIHRQLFRASMSRTMTRRQWEAILGSLNFAAEVCPLGRIRHRRLVREVNSAIPIYPRDSLQQVPGHLTKLLQPWLADRCLQQWAPWIPPPPQVQVSTDASNVGWGYQSSLGHQVQGRWVKRLEQAHINVKGLWVPFKFLSTHQDLHNVGILFEMDNTSAVHCLNRQGYSKSEVLLSLLERIFQEASVRSLHLSALYVPGEENLWADALSCFQHTSVEWQLCPNVFRSQGNRWGTPQVDLFAFPTTAQLPQYFTRNVRTGTGGPDAFAKDWNRWEHIYLFPPPSTKVLLRVCRQLRSYRWRVLLLTPWWPAQPWFSELQQWCPNPLLLGNACLVNSIPTNLQNSLRLHAWSFSVKH
ncbi:hypothetical protein E2C01_056887 [Portunus trituberculatus]|uniref:RNase H type-1 domain-containing protein n=1 Tax=Portunus trituberculatus TaxID=210409 RepID=A0A5B7GYW3_PORTR|nr:hypothetical protein [Portunus trituberculatus]